MRQDTIDIGGWAALVSFPLIVLAGLSTMTGENDLREGPFAWLVAGHAITVALFARGLRTFVARSQGLLLPLASLSLLAGSLGLLALWGGIAMGTAFGIDEPTGIIGVGPIVAGVLALAGFSVGFVLLGLGMLRSQLFPPWAKAVPPVLALETPIALIGAGAAEGAWETAILVAWLSSFGLGWAVLGYAMLARADASCISPSDQAPSSSNLAS